MSESVAKVEKKPCCQQKEHKLYKISELPIYGNPYPKADRIVTEELGYIESGVKRVREEVTPYLSVIRAGSQRANEIIKTSIEHSKVTYDMITSEGNTVGKAGAITAGGLIGLLLAARKGFFKKVFYIGAGLTAASAAVYPNEAKELSQIGFFIVKTKGPELIKEYTGVDLSRKKGSASKPEPKSLDQIAQEVSDVQYYGFRVSEAPSSKKSEPESETSVVKQSNKSQVKGDFGMSKKEDQDLYANRSSK